MSAERLGEWSTANCAPDPCVICQSLVNEPLYPTTYSGSIEKAGIYFLANRTATAHGRIVRCRGCGFVFTSPRFSNSALQQDLPRGSISRGPSPVVRDSEGCSLPQARQNCS